MVFKIFKGLKIQSPAFEVAEEVAKRKPRYSKVQLRDAARYLTKSENARNVFDEMTAANITPLEAYAHIIMVMWMRMRYDLRFASNEADVAGITGSTANTAMDMIGRSPQEAYEGVMEMDVWLSPMGAWEPCGMIKDIFADVDREIFEQDVRHGGDGSVIYQHVGDALRLARMMSVVDIRGAALPGKEDIDLDTLGDSADEDLAALQARCFG